MTENDNIGGRVPMPGMYYPVRCCCQPQKIFGFFRWQSNSIRERVAPLARLPELPANPGDTDMVSLVTVERYYIELHRFWDGTRFTLAVYSDDRPIEFWRQFPQFIEVASADV